MKYKLIVIDIDGTVLKSNHNISQYSRRVLDQAREAGLHVTLASGRNFTNMLHIAQKLGIEEPVISNDGALIKNPMSGEVLFEQAFDGKCLSEILGILSKHGLTYTVHFEHASVSNKPMNYLSMIRRMGKRAIAAGLHEKAVREIKSHDKIVEDLTQKHLKAYKVSTLANHPDASGMKESCREIEECYGKCSKISFSGLRNFEVLPVGVTKAKGLIYLQDFYNVKREEIIAFGDSFNDLDMLRHAGFGIAMGNASDNVKNTADFVTKTNDSHGVAYAIEQILFNGLSSNEASK